MASMPLLDETMHKNGIKVGVGTPNFCTCRAFQETRKTKKTSACWVFAFMAHTLAATDWLITLIVAGRTTCGLYMVPQCLMVLMF
jgi:hypothetical protein